MNNLEELLVSHDELVQVCKALMEITLRAGLQKKLEQKLQEFKVTPGFAQRAEEIEEKYKFERRRLMGSGAIQ